MVRLWPAGRTGNLVCLAGFVILAGNLRAHCVSAAGDLQQYGCTGEVNRGGHHAETDCLAGIDTDTSRTAEREGDGL